MSVITGRDLIVYILEHGLEDEPVFDDGIFLGFMKDIEAAVKFNVGLATIRAWCDIDALPYVRINGAIYIPANAKKPEG